ncbi:ATP synthase subunit b [Labrys miyagiensis]
MRIDWWTLGLQAVNVLVLLWLLQRFLFRPVAAIVAERQASAARLLDDAQTARQQALAEGDAARREAAQIADGRAEAIKAALAEAEAQKAALLSSARAEAERLRAEAEAGIARLRQEEAAAADERASRLAVDIAARLLECLPDSARVTGFVDGLVSALADLPASTLAQLGANGSPVRLKAPRSLSPEEVASCSTALGKVLGRPVDVEVAVDPGLIAGLEIEAAHVAVGNSLCAHLNRIARELARHD